MGPSTARRTVLIVVVFAVLAGGVACAQPAPPTTPSVTPAETTTTEAAVGPGKIDLLMQMLNASSSAALRGLSRDNAILLANIACGAAKRTQDGEVAVVLRSSTLTLRDAYTFVDTANSAYC